MTKKLKNPNRLEGHEGYLIQTLEDMSGYIHCVKEQYRSEPSGWDTIVEIPEGKIGMIVGCNDSDDFNKFYDWIDFLCEDKVCRLFFQHNQWMRYFIPWPHGAFIHQD